jgi:hypothetical protein
MAYDKRRSQLPEVEYTGNKEIYQAGEAALLPNGAYRTNKKKGP